MDDIFVPRREDLNQLMHYFPEITLPVTLTFETHKAFSSQNKALPESLMEMFLDTWEGSERDDYTEYIPGFRCSIMQFTGILYWKGELLHYAYVLVLLDAKGRFIDRLELAETDAEGETIRQGAAVIQADGHIFMVENWHSSQEIPVGTGNAFTSHWEINEEGRYIQASI